MIVPVLDNAGGVIGKIDVEGKRLHASDAETQGLLEECAHALADFFNGRQIALSSRYPKTPSLLIDSGCISNKLIFFNRIRTTQAANPFRTTIRVKKFTPQARTWSKLSRRRLQFDRSCFISDSFNHSSPTS
jgi:hypothetical protein